MDSRQRPAAPLALPVIRRGFPGQVDTKLSTRHSPAGLIHWEHAFGVDGETVKEPANLKDALGRAKMASVEGRPYLLDIHIKREGIGAMSEWHPEFSLADQRSRKV